MFGVDLCVGEPLGELGRSWRWQEWVKGYLCGLEAIQGKKM